MKYVLGIVSIIIGIFGNFVAFTPAGDQFVAQYLPSLLPVIIASVIGVIIAIFGIAKYKEKLLSIIGIITNLVFLVYFSMLAIGLF